MASIIKQLKARFIDTPDFMDLKNIKNIPILIYGDLKHKNRNHNLLRDAKYLGEATTSWNQFIIKSRNMRPVAVDLTIPANFIVGELYAVDPITMLLIDRSCGNTRYTNREMVWVKCVNGSHETRSMQAWMHVGHLDPIEYGTTTTYSVVKDKKQYQEWSG